MNFGPIVEWLKLFIVPALAAGAMAFVSIIASAITTNPVSNDPVVAALILAAVGAIVKVIDAFLGKYTGSRTPLGHIASTIALAAGHSPSSPKG